MVFADRHDAGQRLADLLGKYASRKDLLVLGLPRGGVPVAYEVARRLAAPLDVFLVRKLGVPGREELAMGAIASGGMLVRNDEVIEALKIPERVVEEVARRETEELLRRQRTYRDDRPPPDPRGRCVLLVDDGLATGASMASAVASLRNQAPAAIVVAVPVAAAATLELFRSKVEDLVCVLVPERFFGVSEWYEDFRQTTDEEVRWLLDEAAKPSPTR